MVLPPRGGAKRARNRSKIASKMSFGLKIYKNLLREASKMALKQKKSSIFDFREDLGPGKDPWVKKLPKPPRADPSESLIIKDS